jgi:flagellar biosynthesis GTPase FlhF
VAFALDSRIDDLYRAPLGGFVEARTALAKTLTGDDAKRVRALPKPTLVPWAINQVYWRAHGVFDRLMKSGEKLRDAQVAALEGRKVDVRAAADAHRRAVGDAVQEATTIAGTEGSHPPSDALMRMFEAISLARERGETPGRWTKPIQPAGFEALAGIKLPANTQSEAAKKKEETARKDDAAAQKKAEAARKKHEAEVKKAEAALERARQRMREAEAALKQKRST